MGRRYIAAIVLAILSTATTLPADNWPQWRGPSLDGISQEKNVPLEWGPENNINWKLAMPARSGSTPIVWEKRIFLNVAAGENLYLWCVDRSDGKVLWKRHLGGENVKKRKQNMSSPSPVTDGSSVYVMTGTGILKAFTFDGKEIWHRDIQEDYGPFGLQWGYASSPLLFEDSLYIQVLHGMKTDDPSYLLRIDKQTGKTRWRVERPTDAIRESPDAYTTPALLQVGKKTQIVLTGGDVVTGHDLATGKELWRARGLNPENRGNYRIVASPIAKDGMIYAPTRVRPLLAFRAGGRGDITVSHLAWSTRHGPDVPTPVTDGKYFYIVNDKGIMWCFDAKTGAQIYGGQRLRPGTYSASPVLVDGKIYATSEDGVTTVVKAGPQFEILAENDLMGYTLSSPAISNGQIFLRTEDYLYSIGRPSSGRPTAAGKGWQPSSSGCRLEVQHHSRPHRRQQESGIQEWAQSRFRRVGPQGNNHVHEWGSGKDERHDVKRSAACLKGPNNTDGPRRPQGAGQ